MTVTRWYRVTIAVCAVLAVQAAAAQDATEQTVQQTEVVESEVFAPFVSGLRTAVRDPQVRLVWRDSRDHGDGSYLVLRAQADIVSTNLDDAEVIAEVPAGVETYLDTPLQAGRYFYAVVAIDDDGRPYPILIPFRNKTIRSVRISRLETAEDLAVSVYSLTAVPVGRSVQLRFEASRYDRSLSVYRSTLPFQQSSDFENALLLGSIDNGTRSWIDEPIPGIDYYYAVIDSAMAQRGSAVPIAGQNTLVDPIQISLTGRPAVQVAVRRERLRPAPLPILRVVNSASSANPLASNPIPSASGPLQPTTLDAIDELLARAPAGRSFQPEPVVLPQHRSIDGQGAFRSLTQIVAVEFARGDWPLTVKLLRNLLRLPLDETLEREARFYLGQALYFDGRTHPAFLEFLLAGRGELYAESQIWMDGILLPRG